MRALWTHSWLAFCWHEAAAQKYEYRERKCMLWNDADFITRFWFQYSAPRFFRMSNVSSWSPGIRSRSSSATGLPGVVFTRGPNLYWLGRFMRREDSRDDLEERAECDFEMI